MSSGGRAAELPACTPGGWAFQRRLAASSCRPVRAAAALPCPGQCLWAQCPCQQEMPLSLGGRTCVTVLLLAFPFGKLGTVAKETLALASGQGSCRASEEPGKGTDSLPEGRPCEKRSGRSWQNLGGVLTAGRAWVSLDNLNVPDQMKSWVPDDWVAGLPSPACLLPRGRTSAICGCPRSCPSHHSGASAFAPATLSAKASLFSKAPLVGFLKAVPTHPHARW